MTTPKSLVPKSETTVAVDELATTFRKVCAIKPQLADLAAVAANHERQDLPSVEGWVLPFNHLMANKNLDSFRKPVFAHLLRLHNQAVAKRMEAYQ